MTDNRLAALEAQAASLNIEIAKLRAERPSPPPPPPRDEVRIIALNTERGDLPDLKEARRLYEAVRPLAPWPLDTGYDPDKPFRGFCACFRWLANKGRTDHPNPKFALSFWLDNCKTWLRERNSVAGDIDASTLILAAYAQGDIAYMPANGVLGHVWELALAEHVGRPASPDAWRRVMTTGASAVLPPSAPARRDAPPSQVRVTVGY